MPAARRMLVTASVAVTVAATRAQAQDLSQRFSISDVQDTTFSFAVGKTRWVKPKQRGVAVDARERDALVARFRVVSVKGGLAMAVITGQTMPVVASHTVIMERPPSRWYRNPTFWAGTAVGAVSAGLAAAFAAR